MSSEHAERFARVKHLLFELAEMNVADRAAYLDQACAGEPALRREVESLLSHEEDAAFTRQQAAGRASDRIGPNLQEPRGYGDHHNVERVL